MKIYYTDIRAQDESRSLYPPLSSSRGSAFGASLLAYAYGDFRSAERSVLPQIKRLLGGKPVFAKEPGLHFSISHSRTHVLCALSGAHVGADIHDHRPVRPDTIARLASPEELEHFTFYELWCLRESCFKLTGQGNLRNMRFSRENGKIIAPDPEVFCRIYGDVPDCTVAVCSRKDSFPDELIEVPVEKLLKKESRLLNT